MESQPTHPDLPDLEDDLADFENGDDEDDYEEDDEEDTVSPPSKNRRVESDEEEDIEAFFRRISTERVPVRVHDIVIMGNSKTKADLIQSEIESLLKDATTVRELILAATAANERLRELDIFEAVVITLEAGPPELPGTANVVVYVTEAKNTLTGDIGVFSIPEARSWSLEGSLKLKNLLGFGDILDCSLAAWDQALEISTGVSTKLRVFSMPLSVRLSVLSRDLLKFSSYKERIHGLSLGLFSSGNHDVSYNLSWRMLTDPSQTASLTVRRQLGHSLLSALKYTFKTDLRDSPMRPTQGHAFVSTSQIGGLFPDVRSSRFIRQEFDLRYAIPLGFYRSAINFGISGGVLFPWGSGSLSTTSYMPERFFMGGNSSPVCSLRGPTCILGFKSRGLGPVEPRRLLRDNPISESSDDTGVDHIGGDLALSAFADLSFDLPLAVFRKAGIHGHVFACTGSLSKLNESTFRGFSLEKFRDSFRSSVGAGIVIPTKLFRMEVNYCHILKQLEHDQGKTGIQFSFTSPL